MLCCDVDDPDAECKDSKDITTLSQVENAMLCPETGVGIRKRFHHLVPYESCFVGREAGNCFSFFLLFFFLVFLYIGFNCFLVTWCCERLELSREEAVFLLRTMMYRGAFHHVTYSEPFQGDLIRYKTIKCVLTCVFFWQINRSFIDLRFTIDRRLVRRWRVGVCCRPTNCGKRFCWL